MKKFFVSLVAMAAGTFISANVTATVPDLFPVQGSLYDAGGDRVDGLVDITFSLYAEENNGTALWSDTFEDVDVVDGFFTVYLGSDSVLDFSAFLTNGEIWLGIAVESDPEMNRIQLAAVPFTTEAETCADFSGSAASAIDSTNLVRWNAAYGWGDHSAAGYIDSEEDPVYAAAPAAGITTTQVSNWDTAHGWGDHSAAGYIDSEADPVYAAAPASGITSTHVSNWNTAHGWGDHSAAGYIDSEADPVYAAAPAAGITTTQVSNWNTAYGWGDHGSEGYLTSVNWAVPGTIGSTTRNSGAFTALSANNGLSVSNGTVNIRPGGSTGTNGQVLTTDGSGNATWEDAGGGSSSLSVTVQNNDYVIQATDGLIVTTTGGPHAYTLPLASAAGEGKSIYVFITSSEVNFYVSGSDTLWDASGNSYNSASDPALLWGGHFISDGTNTWYQIHKVD